MNRIYQGRIQGLNIVHKKEQHIEPTQSVNNFEALLWQHHEIFQDAVNYYLLAIGALLSLHASADDDCRITEDFNVRLEEAWKDFPRKPQKHDAKSLRDSMAPWLKLTPESSLHEAFTTILETNKDDTKEAMYLAVRSLLKDLGGGEGKIQQIGRSHLPMFCDPKTNPNFPRGKVNKLKMEGKDVVPNLIYKIPDVPDPSSLRKLKETLRFEYFAKPKQGGGFLSPSQSKDKLREAVKYFFSLQSDDKSRGALDHLASKYNEDEWNSKIDRLPQIEIKEFSGGSINKPQLKKRFFAWLMFNFVEHSEATFNVLKSFYAPPKPRAEKKEKTNDEQLENMLLSLGDDPIKLARGARGYVFKAFTSLPQWGHQLSKPQLAWKEFDIAAFKEALKTVNQFKLKTEEREKSYAEIKATIKWMTEKDSSWQNDKSAEVDEVRPAKLAGDDRYDLARKLEDELSRTVLMENARFSITKASLRGLRDIKGLWIKYYEQKKGLPDEEYLKNIVKEYQAKDATRNDIGSIPLFLTLCQKEFWPLWLKAGHEIQSESTSEHHARDILYSLADLHLLESDLARKQEPINLTPAEPIYSRRLFCFSDVMTAKMRDKLPDMMHKGYCQVPLVVQDNGFYKRDEAKIYFTAPRLHRDQLLEGTESKWLQPMMSALGLDKITTNSLDKFAVSLMPDTYLKKGVVRKRFLLNFPATLKTEQIAAHLNIAKPWIHQFNGTRDAHIHLHWPSTFDGKSKMEGWWSNNSFKEKGFLVLANDLGQRTAGAWSLLKVSSVRPTSKRPFRIIGKTHDTDWYAEIIDTGLYRLPGENEITNRKDATFPSKRGRKPLVDEIQEFHNLEISLNVGPNSFQQTKDLSHLSYPEQNDYLIRLANRALGRNLIYHRWSCFDSRKLKNAGDREKAKKTLTSEIESLGLLELSALVKEDNFEEFKKRCSILFTTSRNEILTPLLNIANRISPLRNRSWRWVSKNDGTPYGELLDDGPVRKIKPRIMGQRGLSLLRLEQLEGLRKLFLRFNRSLDRDAGKVASFGEEDIGRESGEPCQVLLDKINRMKEERINLTSHLILAQALGLQLRTDKTVTDKTIIKQRDLHGEYEVIPGRSPVDMIVLEDLRGYKMSHERGPKENKKLMNWAHRGVLLKLKELTEAFGIPIIETPAAYSSKFDCRNGEPGFRAFETHTFHDIRLISHKKTLERLTALEKECLSTLLGQFERIEGVNRTRIEEGKVPYTLLAPQRGGPLFIGVKSTKATQADINAASNLGLRAIAAPEEFSIHRRIRCINKAGKLFPRGTKTQQANKREQAVFGHGPNILLSHDRSKKLQESANPNFFFDQEQIGSFDKGSISLKNQESIPVCSGVALWRHVKQNEVQICTAINKNRLKKWGLKVNEENR